MPTAVAQKKNSKGKIMYYSGLCKELNKFIRGDVPLSAIKDCFSRYWDRVRNNGNNENEDIIAKVEILQIAVEAYDSGHFLKDELEYIISCHNYRHL